MRVHLLVLLVVLAPAASAYPNHAYPCDVPADEVDGACVGEAEYGACGETGQSDRVSGAAVKFDGRYVADVGGFAQCDRGEDGFARDAHGVYVETPYATFTWSEEAREQDEAYCAEYACDPEGCSWWVYAPGRSARVACPVGPPEPGWGTLLP